MSDPKSTYGEPVEEPTPVDDVARHAEEGLADAEAAGRDAVGDEPAPEPEPAPDARARPEPEPAPEPEPVPSRSPSTSPSPSTTSRSTRPRRPTRPPMARIDDDDDASSRPW